MTSVFVAFVQTGFTFRVFANDPFGYVLKVPRDGEWHEKPDCKWVEVRAPASGGRISIRHRGINSWGFEYLHTGKTPINGHRGFRTTPWRVAAFSCKANAERWMSSTIKHYEELKSFRHSAREQGIPFYGLLYDEEVFFKGTPKEEALRIAIESQWIDQPSSFRKNDLDEKFYCALASVSGATRGVPIDEQLVKKSPQLTALYRALQSGSQVDPASYFMLLHSGSSIEDALARA